MTSADHDMQENEHREETSVVPIEMLKLLDNIPDVVSASASDQAHHPATDIANAARFRELATNMLVWVPDWSTWMMYDGMRWVRDEGGLEAMRVARDIPKVILMEASAKDNSEVRENLAKWSITSGKFERLLHVHLERSRVRCWRDIQAARIPQRVGR